MNTVTTQAQRAQSIAKILASIHAVCEAYLDNIYSSALDPLLVADLAAKALRRRDAEIKAVLSI